MWWEQQSGPAWVPLLVRSSDTWSVKTAIAGTGRTITTGIAGRIIARTGTEPVRVIEVVAISPRLMPGADLFWRGPLTAGLHGSTLSARLFCRFMTVVR